MKTTGIPASSPLPESVWNRLRRLGVEECRLVPGSPLMLGVTRAGRLTWWAGRSIEEAVHRIESASARRALEDE